MASTLEIQSGVDSSSIASLSTSSSTPSLTSSPPLTQSLSVDPVDPVDQIPLEKTSDTASDSPPFPAGDSVRAGRESVNSAFGVSTTIPLVPYHPVVGGLGRRCFGCLKAPGKLSCGKCRSTVYCSKECQTNHWLSSHKTDCGGVMRVGTTSNALVYKHPHSEFISAALSLVNIPNKGRGFVANREIQRGEIMLRSPALAWISNDDLPGVLSKRLFDECVKTPHLQVLFDGVAPVPLGIGEHAIDIELLTPRDKQIYQRAMSEVPHLGVQASRYPMTLRYVLLVLRNQLPLQSNCKPDASGFGVFPLASYINHSCRPNSSIPMVWSKAGPLMVVQAMTTIQPGDEITISYLPDPAQNYLYRSETLCRWNITKCECELCRPQTPEMLAMAEMIDGVKCTNTECKGIMLFEAKDIKEIKCDKEVKEVNEMKDLKENDYTGCYRCRLCKISRPVKEMQDVCRKLSEMQLSASSEDNDDKALVKLINLLKKCDEVFSHYNPTRITVVAEVAVLKTLSTTAYRGAVPKKQKMMEDDILALKKLVQQAERVLLPNRPQLNGYGVVLCIRLAVCEERRLLAKKIIEDHVIGFGGNIDSLCDLYKLPAGALTKPGFKPDR